MTRSQVSETLPEENQEVRVNKIKSKIPQGYVVHFTFEDNGRSYLACYKPTEKDHTKAWVRVEV